MKLTDRDQFIIKIYSMMENKALMDEQGQDTPTAEEMIYLMDELRKVQHPKQTFDFMCDLIEELAIIQDQQVATAKFITKNLDRVRHGL